ncbi:GAF domain/diguanylate cyclase [Klebsiella michiganensis]|uniref:GAF domain/diguanylate cyclase n=1 Tax=Klebsiella michiganensis TaxID=1134687 RepID=A0A7H4LUV1_9ENTR|nr:GAF domain/diguanylate cyclase [Klebsiella michiganensis]
MLELVTRMESTYLTRIDFDAQRQHIMYAHNSSEMQIPEGFSVPWNDSLCKRALDDRCIFSNDVAERWRSCLAAQDLGDRHLFQHSRAPDRRLIIRHAVRHQPGKTAL